MRSWFTEVKFRNKFRPNLFCTKPGLLIKNRKFPICDSFLAVFFLIVTSWWLKLDTLNIYVLNPQAGWNQHSQRSMDNKQTMLTVSDTKCFSYINSSNFHKTQEVNTVTQWRTG